MVTLKDLAEDWIKARAALKQQIKMLESDAAFPQAELSEDVRNAITARINIELLPVLKTPSLVFLWNREVCHGETEVHARVQA
jgi:hypothetical protein